MVSKVTPRQPGKRSLLSIKAKTDHNLAVELAARAMVCDYERRQGREPVEMPHHNPGYDIRSQDPCIGEIRLIEIKSLAESWSGFGVGMSRRQFSEAWDEGERYWLYVVENIRNLEQARILPIQNPAMKVDTFNFDHNWTAVADTETLDGIHAGFYVGVLIEHSAFGYGRILSRERQGGSQMLTIEFQYGLNKIKRLELNPSLMKIVEKLEEGEADKEKTA